MIKIITILDGSTMLFMLGVACLLSEEVANLCKAICKMETSQNGANDSLFLKGKLGSHW